MLGKLPELAELLDSERAEGPDLRAPQDTPYGLLSPPLGQARLKAVEVLYSILGLSDPAAEQGALTSQGVADTLLAVSSHFAICVDLRCNMRLLNGAHQLVVLNGERQWSSTWSQGTPT